MTNLYLQHHGVEGQKWGVRRYQNKDGTLTSAGKKRYASEAADNNWEIGSDGLARSTSNKNKGTVMKANPNKWVKEDIDRSKKLTDSGSDMANKLNTLSKATSSKKSNRQDLSNMSDKELRDKVNRELLERQYNSVFNESNENTGREKVTKVLETTGAVLGVTSSALGIALALKELGV